MNNDLLKHIDGKDWFDLEKPIVNDIYVDLPPKARDLYDKMEKEMFTEIEEKGVEAFSAAGRATKCAQIANGAVYTDDTGAWEEIHDAKLEPWKTPLRVQGTGGEWLLSLDRKSVV